MLDPCSSAWWFSGFSVRAGPALTALHEEHGAWLALADVERPAVVAARSWLARTGWARRGLVQPTETPTRIM